MANRYTEPGWELMSMHDSVYRRGVWYRQNGDAVELCAGREGDDWFVRLEPGKVDASALRHLLDCLSTGRWMVEEAAFNDPRLRECVERTGGPKPQDEDDPPSAD